MTVMTNKVLNRSSVFGVTFTGRVVIKLQSLSGYAFWKPNTSQNFTKCSLFMVNVLKFQTQVVCQKEAV